VKGHRVKELFLNKRLPFCFTIKKTSQLVNDDICDFTIDVDNNVLYYYVQEDGLYKQQLSGGDAEQIYKYVKDSTNICRISYDGRSLCKRVINYFLEMETTFLVIIVILR
jgi:hypothetical protein